MYVLRAPTGQGPPSRSEIVSLIRERENPVYQRAPVPNLRVGRQESELEAVG